MPFLYLLSGDDLDLELAQAEFWALTGSEASGRVCMAPVACDISRSAFVRVCGEVLAQSSTLEGLCGAVAQTGIVADKFRIEVRKRSPKVSDSPLRIACDLADSMEGYPDLSDPREKYLVVCREGEWQFTRVLSETGRGHELQSSRPHNFSQALCARHARALVNLVAAPGDTVLDPCCGVGTSLTEALLMGVRAVGCDVSKPVVWHAAANLEHLGLAKRLGVADARAVAGSFEAAVIDFPYGHSSRAEEGLYEEILNNIAPQAFRIAVVTGGPVDELFASLSLRVLRCARVRARRLVRHFYVLEGLRGR